MSTDIVIIGGGAAGIAAAIFAARGGSCVTVLEKNEKPLKKLLATGNGRCNLTNLEPKEDSWRSADPERAGAVVGRFGPSEAVRFFESIGVFTKDRDGWVYPVNDQAASVADHLLREAQRLKVRIKTRENVTGIERDREGFLCRTGTYAYRADAVIVASGSCAWYKDGDAPAARNFADSFGIPYRETEPALVPLILEGAVVGKWGNDRVSGTVRLFENGVRIAEKSGELQLTSYGISGIPVLQVSSFIRKDRKADYEVGLDLLSGKGVREAAERILGLYRDGKLQTGEEAKRFLSGLFPEKLFRATFDPKEGAEAYLLKMRDLRLKVRRKRGLENAMTVSGGVRLSALTEDLETSDVRGLYFIGEAADVDGDCGGFSLQWAWSSAHAAAEGIINHI